MCCGYFYSIQPILRLTESKINKLGLNVGNTRHFEIKACTVLRFTQNTKWPNPICDNYVPQCNDELSWLFTNKLSATR